jgi:predicted MFS family arabinose efflux permease
MADQSTTAPILQASGETSQRVSGWTSVFALSAGAFAMVTSEMLPVGVLSQMARDLKMSGGVAGILVSAPGITATISAPLAAVLARRVDRKMLLVMVGLLIVGSNLLVSVAHGLALAIAGRILLGACVGTFWALSPSVGRRLVAAQAGNRAMAIVLGGISLGAVIGVPAGTAMAQAVGWRFAFAIVAMVTLLTVLGQILLMPSLPSEQSVKPSQLLAVLRIHSAQLAFGATALVVAGHFAAYTFLEPYLRDVVGMRPTSVVWMLFAYGAAGVLGTLLAERAAVINVRLTYLVTAVALGSVLLVASVWAGAPAPVVAFMVAVWGLLFGAIPVCIQLLLFDISPRDVEAFSATLVSVFQIALALGSWSGGEVVDALGVASTFKFAAFLSAVAALVLVVVVSRHRNRPQLA